MQKRVWYVPASKHVYGCARKQFSRSAANTLILSFDCRLRRLLPTSAVASTAPRHRFSFYWRTFLVSTLRVSLFCRICLTLTCTRRIDRHHRVLLENSFRRRVWSARVAAPFCVSRGRTRRIVHCVSCRSGWIHFHAFCVKEIVVVGTIIDVAVVAFAACVLCASLRRSPNKNRWRSNAERPQQRKKRKNSSWTWMMYLRGITWMIGFHWHRPIHTYHAHIHAMRSYIR